MTNFNSHGVQSHNASNRNLGISANRIAQETNDKLLTSHTKLDTLNTSLTGGTQVAKIQGSDGSTIHGDGSGNVKANVINAVHINPSNASNADHVNYSSHALAVGLRGRTNVSDHTTGEFLLCDAQGHLQVDIVSGGVGGDASSANQTTMIGHLSEIEGAVETIEGCVSGSEVQVDIVSSALPTGGATSALQTTGNSSLATIASDTSSLDGKVTACNTGAVTISASALPTGGATSALQTTGNSSLSSIDGKVTACDTGAVVVSSSALPTGGATSALQTSGNLSLTTIASDTTSLDGKVTACNTGAVVVSSSALPSGGATSALQTTGNNSLATIAGDTTSLDGKVTACNTGAVTISSSVLPTGGATSALQTSGNSSLTSIDGKVTACNTGAVVVSSSALPSGGATSALQSTLNSKIDTIDAVLDNIKIDTEAIETAVEAIQALEELTTTLIIDGQSVASGGGTHTSSSFEVTKKPKGDGKLHFLVRISGVSAGDIGASIQVSADDTNFFGLDLGFVNQGTAITGVGQFVTCSFVAKYVKVTLSNSSFSSNATCSVHMFT